MKRFVFMLACILVLCSCAAADEKSEGYIPKESRIAVFDMDSTLTCANFYTDYDTMMFIEFCLKDNPEKV